MLLSLIQQKVSSPFTFTNYQTNNFSPSFSQKQEGEVIECQQAQAKPLEDKQVSQVFHFLWVANILCTSLR